MRGLALALAPLLLLAPVAARAQVEDRVVNVATDDAEMVAAKKQGAATLPVFFGHVGAPGPDETGFAIKYDLLPEPDQAEFIWAEVIAHKDGVTIAHLSNVPKDPRFTQGQQVSVRDSEVVDWSYWKGNVMQGSFTTRALLKHLAPEEAAALRKQLGWN